MNIELRKMIIENRIARLRGNGRENGNIRRKLERQLRNLNK